MSLDGLRAWIGEVEHKLGMRTRVFLVLTVIAIGGAGAAIYLAIDTRDNAVSESDVQELQEELEAQIGGGGSATGAGVAQLEAEVEALQAQVSQLRGEDSSSKSGKSDGAPSGDENSGGGVPGEGPSGAAGGTVPGGDASAAKLKELLEQAQKQREEAE